MSLTKFNTDSPIQKIKASFLDDDIELTPKQNKLKEKIRFAFTLRLQNNYSPTQTVEMLMEEYTCSRATAYRIYQKSMYVLGSIDETDMKAEKIILRETHYRLYQELITKKKYELAMKALEQYQKLCDFTEKSELEEGQLKPNQYQIVIDRQSKKIMIDQITTGLVDLNSYPNIEDITYKEVTDEEN